MGKVQGVVHHVAEKFQGVVHHGEGKVQGVVHHGEGKVQGVTHQGEDKLQVMDLRREVPQGALHQVEEKLLQLVRGKIQWGENRLAENQIKKFLTTEVFVLSERFMLNVSLTFLYNKI